MSTEAWHLKGGTGEVEVVAYGGRISLLRPAPDLPNALWRGAVLLPLTGGDRLWLGPERDVFYPPGDTQRESWRCPEELDPGNWVITQHGDEIVVTQEALGATMTRRVRAADQLPVPCDLPWTGVHIAESVTGDVPFSGWHLTMTHAPASVFVRDAREPLDLYGSPQPIDAGWVHASGGPPEWKLGFPPPSDGRVVLASVADADPGPVVAVAADVDPGGTYLDVRPRDGARATALQVYNAPGQGFCEIEHHFPAETRAGETLLFAAWGAREERLALVGRLAA